MPTTSPKNLNEDVALESLGFLRVKDVLKLVPVSRAWWYRGVAQGLFPQPVVLSPHVSFYRRSDIEALLKRMAANDNGGRKSAPKK